MRISFCVVTFYVESFCINLTGFDDLKCYKTLTFFSHKETFDTALISLAKTFLALEFSFRCCTLSKQGRWTLFVLVSHVNEVTQ